MKKTQKMWEGRFETGMAPSMEAISFSLKVDCKLLTEDVDASVAHCSALLDAKVVTKDEYVKMTEGLKEIRTEILAGADHLYSDKDEDIHMSIERILTDRLGDLGKKTSFRSFT